MVIRAKKLGIILLLIVLVSVAVLGIKYTAQRLYETAYPKKFSLIVEQYSKEYDIDEDILYAIIKTESDFNPNATSKVGARGLTQIMENTYNWIKTKLGDDKTTYDDMYDPNFSIKYAAFLIDYLHDEFGSYETAAAAYHAGRTATKKWLNNQEHSKDGINLDSIPIRETEHYVNKVMKNYEMYKKIYKKN